MRNMFVRLVLAAVFLLNTVESVTADVILISEIPGSDSPVILGDQNEAAEHYSPASTFKIVITLAGLLNGSLSEDTTVVCRDDFLPENVMKLNLQQALYHSSNEYFISALQKISSKELLEISEKCHFGKVQAGKISEDKAEWRHGGPIKISPLEAHLFMRELSQCKLPLDVEVQKRTLKVLSWPKRNLECGVLGKTGSWENRYWFTGLAEWKDHRRIITVFLTKKDGSRQKAIDTFYEQVTAKLTKN
jgi:beta-lactamase class D